MRYVFSAALMFVLACAAFSQVKFYENGQSTRTGLDAALFPDSPTRTKLDLSGIWQYTLDGKEWNAVSIPSAYDFSGKVTFNRKFEVNAEMLDKYAFSLVCYGINNQCDIAINGNFVGRHQGGYTSFILQIPPNILQMGKENVIKISVDNELTPRTTLPLRQQAGGWRTYGGIFRDVYLLAAPKLFIEDIYVKSELAMEGRYAKVAVRGDITDRGSGVKAEPGTLLGFQVEAFDKLTGDAAGRSNIIQVSLQINKSISVSTEVTIAAPKPWSPDTANLYVFKCQIVRVAGKEITPLDEYDIDAGLRETRWQDGKLYVNGRLTVLKGLLWMEDHATFASAMSYEALERDVAMMKTLGANTVRFLYPPHPYMLNLCDRYGLMVMEEIPLVGVPAEILKEDYYQELATNYVKEMVARDKNHVSIVAWGVGDSFESAVSSCEYINSARNVINAVDKRSVYFSTNRTNDTCSEYVDLVTLNYDGIDAKEFRDVLKQIKMRQVGKPIVVTRYGSEVEPGNRNGYSDPHSMETQARTAMQCFDVMREAKIAGSVLWSFNDWRTDRPSLTTYSQDPFLRTMGIVSYEREKRVAFDVIRAIFNGEKVQALPLGNYVANTPIIYVVAGLFTLIAFAFVYNGNRRFRDAVNRSMFRTYNFFADVRDQRILSHGHSMFLAATISVTWAILLSSVFSYYRGSIFFDNLLNQIMSDQIKEWFIRLVWSPPKFILVMSVMLFVKLFVLSVFIRLFSMMVRTRVYFYHSYSVTMWALLPYVVLIPLVMILYRLLENQFYIVPIFVFILIISIWVLFRLMKGISIIYDVYPFKVYAVGLLMLIILGGVLYGYADYTRSTSVYLKYMMHTSKNTL